MKCGACFPNIWRDRFFTPSGRQVGECIFRAAETYEDHRCDVPLICLEQMQYAIQEIIAKRKLEEAEERAV